MRAPSQPSLVSKSHTLKIECRVCHKHKVVHLDTIQYVNWREGRFVRVSPDAAILLNEKVCASC